MKVLDIDMPQLAKEWLDIIKFVMEPKVIEFVNESYVDDGDREIVSWHIDFDDYSVPNPDENGKINVEVAVYSPGGQYEPPSCDLVDYGTFDRIDDVLRDIKIKEAEHWVDVALWNYGEKKHLEEMAALAGEEFRY